MTSGAEARIMTDRSQPRGASPIAPSMPAGSIDITKWWRYKELRTLNLLLLIPLLSIFSQGCVTARLPILGTNGRRADHGAC